MGKFKTKNVTKKKILIRSVLPWLYSKVWNIEIEYVSDHLKCRNFNVTSNADLKKEIRLSKSNVI